MNPGIPSVVCQSCREVVYCTEIALADGVIFEGDCRCGARIVVTSGVPMAPEQPVVYDGSILAR